jgi:hypothetical protein
MFKIGQGTSQEIPNPEPYPKIPLKLAQLNLWQPGCNKERETISGTENGQLTTISRRNAMKHLIAVAAALALAAAPAFASEATFERNLTFSGRAELSVSTGSGHVHLSQGSSGRIHVFARVHSNWGGSDDQVRQIAANPPIEQTGNIIRIGRHENLHNITIDYDIQAPADTYLDASTGSGDIADEGVGENARLNTGSGSINASGLKNGFSVGTGSGNITADQLGQGDVKAETGSGSIDLHNLKGALHAHTGSGNIKVAGSPSSDWKLDTGSGSIDLAVGNSGLTLDASTGSGRISTDHEMTVQGSFDKHHITGKLNGGGPAVRAETGSGNIEVH